jgi:DNA-binding beta-propeller fold protein YncE
VRRTNPGRVLPRAALSVLLVVLALPATGHATWSSPIFLHSGWSFEPRVAVDPDGNAVFAWTYLTHALYGTTYVQTSTLSATGSLSPFRTISARGAAGPEVAVGADGDAVFVWTRNDGTTGCGGSGCVRLQVRTRSATGTMGTIQTLSAAGQHATSPQVAVDTAGNALIVWERLDGSSSSCCVRIEARARSAAGSLGPVQTLSGPGQDARFPGLGVDAGGNAVVSWMRFDGSDPGTASPCCWRIQVRARSATGTLGPIQTLSVPGQNAVAARVAVEPDGDAVITWQRDDGSSEYCCSRIQARARSRTGALGPIHVLSGSGQHAGDARVAVDPDGDAVVVWRRDDGSATYCCNRIQARSRSAAGTVGLIQTLSAPGQNASWPHLGIDAAGNAVVVWRRFDGEDHRIQARVRTAAGTLKPVETLSPPGQNAGELDRPADGPRVAVEPDGDAAAVWMAFHIYAATGP